MDSSRPAVHQGGSVTSADTSALGGAALQAFHGVLSRSLVFWEVWPLVGFASVLVLVYLLTAPVFGLPFDDSYISLQFARNLAGHGFLTFDGETASAGATSLLHVAILAIPIKLGVDPVKASVAVGVLLQLGLVVAMYWLAWTIFKDRLVAALSGASVGVMGYLVFDALNGMETTLFLVVSTAAVAAFLGARSERRYLAAGILAAIAVLTRPEGGLLLGAMGLYYLVNPERGEPVASLPALRRLALLAGPSVVALIGLAAFYWATTGSPTPGTATAKYLFFREFEIRRQIQADWVQTAVANFIAPVLPWLALAAFSFRRRETLLFVFFWASFIIMYFLLFPGGLSHYWYRYQHIFLPAIAVFGSAGLISFLRGHRWRRWDVVSAGLIGVMLLGAVLFQYNSYRNLYADNVNLNETRQVAIARFLRQVMPAGATVATHDIGVIGYYSEREVIDLVGLVNPDVIDYHDGRRLREYVDQVQPAYIVVFPSWEDRYLQLGLRDNPELFEEIEVFWGGLEPFIVYKTHY